MARLDNDARQPVLDAWSLPLVWLRAPGRPLDAVEAQSLLAGLARLLDDGARHAVISTGGPPDLPAAESRAFALWFKRERDRLARLCAGMAVVVPAGPALEAFRAQFDKAAGAGAYPYPVIVVAEEAEAIAWAEARLASGVGR